MKPVHKLVVFGFLGLLALIGTILAFNKNGANVEQAKVVVPSNNEQKQPESKPSLPKVKNVILMIGDGMGVPQVAYTVMYHKFRTPNAQPLNLAKLYQGPNALATNYTYKGVVVDSASAATSMACGIKALSEVMGMDPQGYPCETVLEKAVKLGKATGLVSNTRLTHATPGAFASHQISRHLENDIAIDQLEKHDIDVLLDGGLQHLIPQYKDEATKTEMKMSDLAECGGIDAAIDGKSKREDQKNLIDIAKQKGSKFVCTTQQLDGIIPDANTKVLGVFSNSVFPMIQERSKIASLPSVPHMTERAIEILDKKPNGFFLMVEGGLIDYAGHDNDAGALFQEMLDFDAAVGIALKYVETHPDTLLIVTADHETGGFGFSYRAADKREEILPSGLVHKEKYSFMMQNQMDILLKQTKSFRAIVQPIIKKLYPAKPEDKPILMLDAVKLLASEITANTAYVLSDEQLQAALTRKAGAKDFETHDFKEFYVYDPLHADALGRAVAAQTNTVWATGTHTGSPVNLFVQGPARYTDKVKGLMDNTNVAQLINAALEGVEFNPTTPKSHDWSIPESQPVVAEVNVATPKANVKPK